MQKVHNQVNQLTLPQNGGNRVSEDLDPSTRAPPSADAFHRTPFPKNLDPRQNSARFPKLAVALALYVASSTPLLICLWCRADMKRF